MDYLGNLLHAGSVQDCCNRVHKSIQRYLFVNSTLENLKLKPKGHLSTDHICGLSSIGDVTADVTADV